MAEVGGLAEKKGQGGMDIPRPPARAAHIDRPAKGPFQGSRRAGRAAEGFFRTFPASCDGDHDGGQGRFADPHQDVAQAQAGKFV